jgi:hypothetical protein
MPQSTETHIGTIGLARKVLEVRPDFGGDYEVLVRIPDLGTFRVFLRPGDRLIAPPNAVFVEAAQHTDPEPPDELIDAIVCNEAPISCDGSILILGAI